MSDAQDVDRDDRGKGPTQGGEAAGRSVLQFLEQKTGAARRVTLRDEESAETAAPLIDPRSEEKQAIPQGRGTYQFMGEIARGGMGVILKGHDTDLGRDVAVKVLDKRLSERMDVVQRFVEEAQIGGQLQHPGIVPVYELGMMADERPYFTMKLVKGRTLAALLAARETTSSNRGNLIEIFEAVCQTMAYAHSRGVIHRDLKPANIMVGAFGEVQVVDWGLAKVLPRGGTADEKLAREAHTQMTVLETVRSPGSPGSSTGTDSMLGSILGTPAYMPPEQASGYVDRLDERSDVFALGAILCEILTGLPPYHGERDEVISAAAQAELSEAMVRLDACDADAALVKITKQCLTAAPAARPADAGVLAERVHGHVISVGERAHQAEVDAAAADARAQEERRARKLTLALGAAVLAALLVGGGGWLFVQSERAARVAAEAARVKAAAEQDRVLAGEVNEALSAASVFAGAEDWNEALVAAERARALAEGGGASGELLASVDAQMESLRTSMDAAREREELRADTRRLLAELREVGRPNVEQGMAARATSFRDTFLAHGIDLEAGALEAAAEQLTRRGLGAEVARALDTWSDERREDGDREGAERLLDLAHRVDPDPERAHLREAMYARDLKELRFLATSGFEQQPPGTIALLASALLRLGERDLAHAVYRAGIEQHPGDFELLYLLAYELTPGAVEPGLPEELTEAAQLYRAALAVQPENAWTRFYLGWVLQKAGDRERALEQLERALDLEPDNGSFRFWLAQLQWELGRHEEARASWERTVELGDPGVKGWALSGLAFDAVRRGDFALVRDLVRGAWDSGNSIDEVVRTYMLGPLVGLSSATGDEAPMLEARDRLASWAAKQPEPHNALAWFVVQQTGRVGQTKPPWHPISDAARQMLLGHAAELARSAVEMDPSRFEYWNSLGMALYCAGDFEGALAALSKEYELLGEGDARNWLCLAMTRHALGDDDAARDGYARAVRWMAANETDEQLQWYRAEAARVLGL
jgi:serine/threonine-protein kinase